MLVFGAVLKIPNSGKYCFCHRHVSLKTSKISRQRRSTLEKILRVDHAGEHGAVKIYQGQIFLLGRTDVGPVLEDFLQQERNHFGKFNKLLLQYHTQPTVMLPVWTLGAFGLGIASALLSKEAAMACTVAVETVIGEHYDNQIRALMFDSNDGLAQHKELLDIIREFRDDELEHLETGLKLNAEKAPLSSLFGEVVKLGCKTAIWISERI